MQLRFNNTYREVSSNWYVENIPRVNDQFHWRHPDFVRISRDPIEVKDTEVCDLDCSVGGNAGREFGMSRDR
jgi:hypothetical protein